ncbi:potassium/proton antiporter [Lachnoanaerobaculum saburreum]|uniref:Potassium/proton antiporter n=1 Tax=Lachnoanaerobaculum saburreum TaxID=467210 RepID=A0A133ZJH0_9FIRM|nr:potassium/proton antiporter [Lachnoanaerobaculum saburreum]KXB55579.1 potassium/proton antiporter [Lachnoanaerobaculum saburreum]
MNTMLLMMSVIILLCIMLNIISSKIGVPVLLAFILLGMVFGSDGIFKIKFDDFNQAETICSFALIFIMFYGGFGTNINEAKPIALKAGLLSSIGVLLTSVFVALFGHYILRFSWINSMLIGAVISSTDAASVFSILRDRHLNLKDNTASILEVESGSNDPFAYMITMIVIKIIAGGITPFDIFSMLFLQLFLGVLCGVLIALIFRYFINKFIIHTPGFNMVLIIAVALLSYALPNVLGGNGYLSVYITGIILGNSDIRGKKELVPFFDGITGIMQILIFFLLGLLSYPTQLLRVAGTGLILALFITFIVRPLVIALILKPFKSKWNQVFLVSWSGFRGASSIVFAIAALLSTNANYDVFNNVFFIVLFSISLQGSLLPFMSKKLDMIDETCDVMKTFSDYAGEEIPIEFIQLTLNGEQGWCNKSISEINFPPDTLLVLVKRDGEDIVPNGQTVLKYGDTVVLAAKSIDFEESYSIVEHTVTKKMLTKGNTLAKLSDELDGLVMLIIRGDEFIIPNGETVLCEKDVLVLNKGPI